MTDIELAKACAQTQCHKCRDEIKQECLKNRCWADKQVKNRECPAVYYGILPRQK